MPFPDISELLDANAVRRPTPSLDSPFFVVQETPHAGRGAFSSRAIPSGTDLFECDSPSVNVVYKPFKKEVCGWCFRYEGGRKMKVAHMSNESANGTGGIGLAWFCSEICRSWWKARLGDAGIAALSTVTVALSKHKRAKLPSQANEKPEGNVRTANVDSKGVDKSVEDRLAHAPPVTEADIEEAWARTAHAPPNSTLRLIEDVDDENALLFLLDGMVVRHQSPAIWDKLLSLNPSLTPYTSRPGVLASHIRLYDFLRLYLPPTSPIRDYCTPETILALVTRDFGNSFGIWEAVDFEDGEMLGYGCWVEASFFNHSCEPNLKKRISGRTFQFYTIREVAHAGEQLTINYIGEAKDAPLAERRAQLQKGWGFCCQCTKCLREEGAADRGCES